MHLAVNSVSMKTKQLKILAYLSLFLQESQYVFALKADVSPVFNTSLRLKLRLVRLFGKKSSYWNYFDKAINWTGSIKCIIVIQIVLLCLFFTTF